MRSLLDSLEFNRSLFFPRRDATPAPPGAVDTFVAVAGGALHLRRHGRAAPAGTLLLFHGNGEVVSDYDGLAPRFAACGVDLAVVDYRGYGRSDGTPTLRLLLEDARRVVAAVAADAPRLLVMGRSLGSACAAEIYRAPPPEVTGFVWESGAVDLPGLVARRGLSTRIELTDEDLETFDPCRKLAAGDRPLLVLHGEDDTLIPPEEGQRAFAVAGTVDKTLCLIADHGHNDLFLSRRYWEALRDFVSRRPGSPK